MNPRFRRLLAAAFAGTVFALPFASRAMDLTGQDTDLFLTNPNIPAEVPNVLIVIDNTSNWSAANQQWPSTDITGDSVCGPAGFTGTKQGDAELCAIYKQAQTLTESVNVGVMMFNDQNAGAFVRFSMSSMNATNRAALQSNFLAVETAPITSPAYKTASNAAYEFPMNDAFRYLNSLPTYGGAGAASATVLDPAGYTSSAATTFSFAAPSTSTCGYDYIIFIGNGFPNTDRSFPGDLTAAAALLNDSAVTPNTNVINSTGSNADVWSRFMYNYGVKVGPGAYRHVTTYTIDVCNAQCDPNQATLLQSMASVSYGRYFRATNLQAISTALSTIFAQVQAVNSVFAATALPVSINVRGTNLNQVYIGVFRPDAHLSPRWWGNLKQYELGVSSTGLQLVDAVNAPAVNLNTGFVANTAQSFWTTGPTCPAANPGCGFWSFRAPYPGTDAGGPSDLPDGDLVEKGGAAQLIRKTYPNPDSTAAQTRKMFTCTGSCLSATPGTGVSLNVAFDSTTDNPTLFVAGNTNITAGLLGTFQTVNVTSLIASGSTATATTDAAHNFNIGDSVTVTGALPNLFNGTYPVASVPDSTHFTYTLTSTPDTTHAYVTLNTLNGSGLTVSTDLITVTGSTPADYNVADQSVSAVVGNANQVSYPLATQPASASSGYSVTAKRGITSLSWDSGTRLASVGVAAPHNYVTGDSVTISGVVDPSTGLADTVLNGTFAITKTSAAAFTYSTGASTPSGGSITNAVATTSAAIPGSWGAGNNVTVSGTGNSVYDTTGAIATTGTNTFSYKANGTPSATVNGTFTAHKVVTGETNVWTVSSAAVAVTGTGNSKVFTVTLTLNQNCSPPNTSSSTACASSGTSPTEPTPGQNPQTLATTTSASSFTNSSITVAGVSCTTKQGNSNVAISGCSASGIAITAVSNSGGSTLTVSYTPAGLQGASAPSNPTVSTSSATVSATGPTGSPAITVTSIAPGNVTVTRTGTTMYAAKTGDLTPYVTSIANQSVATGTITAGLATNADPNERANLIAWMRGIDNKDNENGSNTLLSATDQSWVPSSPAVNDTTDVRASVHGDVLHSRPAVVNYNRDGTNNDVYLFYGANDGVFHAVKGGQAADGGQEQWGFIADDFFGKLKRLRNQTPGISSLTPRDYFFDGPIGVYTLDAAYTSFPNGNSKLGDGIGSGGTLPDKAQLFIAMRRGGRKIYALDVSDPANPKFLWEKGCPNPTGTTGCDAGWGEIGQTWSIPQLGYLRAFPGKLLLMFAAGYDAPAEDFQACAITAYDSTSVTAKTGVVMPNTQISSNCPPSGGSSTTVNRSMGRGIYIVDASNGNVLWRAVSSHALTETVTGMTSVTVSGMNYAMPADLAILKNRDDTSTRTSIGSESVPLGYMDRIYATDTRGNIWRVDVANASVSNWVVTRLANVAPSSGSNPVTNMRKFLQSPDVVYSGDSSGDYDAVLIGSGDREHPFDQIVTNYFYMFKDRNTGTITPSMVNSVSSAPSTLNNALGSGFYGALTTNELVDVTSDCAQSASLCTGSQTQATTLTNLASMQGWFLQLTNSGEKTIAPATTSAGTVIFNTNSPSQDTITGTAPNVGPNAGKNFCTSDLGTARQYGLNFQNATSNNIFAALPANFQSSTGQYATFAGGGFLPAPVPVVVQIGGKYYQTVISGVQATNPGGLTLQTRVRTYWRSQQK